MARYSWMRLWAIISKEFIQIKRDKGTFAMIVGIPLMQVILFGYAINNDPKHLPTAIIASDYSIFTRDLIQGMKNSGYFHFSHQAKSEADAEKMLATGKVLFVLNIPPNFTRDFIRGNRPSLLLEADATDPTSTANALSAATNLVQSVFSYNSQGALNYLGKPISGFSRNAYPDIQQSSNVAAPVDLRVHAKYNPAGITQLNIVPGLMGVVLTMTMVMITAVAITRERERGTMENLLATPAQPLEVMVGKVLPYIFVGYIQMSLILVAAGLLFNVPIKGSILLLFISALPFIAANLAVGLAMSTVAKNQLQSIQMTTFFFLPSILLSGFMFPFPGMPTWAQYIGQLLPLTHFLRITRGILLKGNGLAEIWPNLWPIFVFLFVIILLGVKRYRRTLD